MPVLLLSAALPALAQSDSNDSAAVDYADWYQVELIAFRQLYPTDTELYQERPPAALPEDLHRLLPSAEESARLVAEEQAQREAEEHELGEAAEPPAALILEAASEATTQEPGLEPADPLRPRAFARLDDAQRLLNDTAQSIRRSRGYRLLAHEAWRQPFTEGGGATRVVLSGGEAFGAHRELEGFVELERARYLHVTAHLWLSRFEPASDFSGEPIELPSLPEPPVVLPETASTIVGPRLSWTSAVAEEPVDVVLGPDGRPRDDTAPAAAYLAADAWVLSERRRLRSGELHYLDHPRFGLLVYVEPWAPEPPEPAPSD